MESKYFRKFALGIIIDKEKNLIIQDRTKHSKANEKYGFFGGGIEEGETEVDALNRELFEEMGIRLDHFRLWKTKEIDIQGYGLGLFHYFIIPLNDDFLDVKSIEGDILRITADEFLKKTDIEPEDREILEELLFEWDDVLETYLRY